MLAHWPQHIITFKFIQTELIPPFLLTSIQQVPLPSPSESSTLTTTCRTLVKIIPTRARVRDQAG